MPKKESRARNPRPAPAATAGIRRPSSRRQPIEHASDEQIRVRAYQFYLQRNAAPGDPVADWLRAERELAVEMAPRKRSRSVAASAAAQPVD